MRTRAAVPPLLHCGPCARVQGCTSLGHLNWAQSPFSPVVEKKIHFDRRYGKLVVSEAAEREDAPMSEIVVTALEVVLVSAYSRNVYRGRIGCGGRDL